MENRNKQQLLYINRINKVVEHIDDNLDAELSLEKLSEIACFSPFHFHRIFCALLDETPNNYITRRRIEKIAGRLFFMQKEDSLTDLALGYGFKSIHSFSRSFRKFYGISASEFQKRSQNEFSKIGKIQSKNGTEHVSFEKYFYTMDNLKIWLQMKTQVEVKEMPELRMVQVRHQGPYKEIGKAFDALMKWAGPRGLLNFPKTKMAGIYYDSPRVTDESKMQSSACITIMEDVEVSGEVSKITIPKGKFAVGSFKIKVEEFEKAWNSMSLWIPENNFELRKGHHYEVYHNDAEQHPENLWFVDICIPVK
ncbi:AraC family transcriptional regulator [Maribacter halichondriae]|uniref:AraC family transcriptional regulator n=1 Tax=Maribacter halichondriae TaxID=2980554 RepID=UPI002359584C|nr:AraC family transcriptional regulator [Maribacter sp. Hal144]